MVKQMEVKWRTVGGYFIGKTAEETLQNIQKAISKKTKLISVPHIPCTIGQVLPVKEICRIAKEKNIGTFLDGAHPPGMLQLDLKDIGCDFYAGCCHKWMLGPKGTGFLYCLLYTSSTIVTKQVLPLFWAYLSLI